MAVMTKGFLNALAFCCTSTQLDLSTDSATAKHPILQLQIKDKTRCEKMHYRAMECSMMKARPT
jgi:hypothetical protein